MIITIFASDQKVESETDNVVFERRSGEAWLWYSWQMSVGMRAQRSTTVRVPEWYRLQVKASIAGQRRPAQRSTAFTGAGCMDRGTEELSQEGVPHQQSKLRHREQGMRNRACQSN